MIRVSTIDILLDHATEIVECESSTDDEIKLLALLSSLFVNMLRADDMSIHFFLTAKNMLSSILMMV